MATTDIVEVGAPAPDFALPSAASTTIRLADFRDKQNLVIFFMREFR